MSLRNCSHHLVRAAFSLTFFVCSEVAFGQTVTITVVDSLSGRALPGAAAEIRYEQGQRSSAFADSAGTLLIRIANLREIEIHRLGYFSVRLEGAAIVAGQHIVRMRPNPTQLRALSVAGTNPYQILNPAVENLYARRQGKLRPRTHILLKGDPLFEGRMTVKELRRQILRTSRTRACRRGPLWFLNGFAYSNIPWGEEFDQMSLVMLEGIEFFSAGASVPAEYWRPGYECGVIALWTRVS